MKNFLNIILTNWFYLGLLIFTPVVILITIIIYIPKDITTIKPEDTVVITSYDQAMNDMKASIIAFENIISKRIAVNNPKGFIQEIKSLIENMDKSFDKGELAYRKLLKEKEYLEYYLALQRRNEKEYEEFDLDPLNELDYE